MLRPSSRSRCTSGTSTVGERNRRIRNVAGNPLAAKTASADDSGATPRVDRHAGPCSTLTVLMERREQHDILSSAIRSSGHQHASQSTRNPPLGQVRARRLGAGNRRWRRERMHRRHGWPSERSRRSVSPERRDRRRRARACQERQLHHALPEIDRRRARNQIRRRWDGRDGTPGARGCTPGPWRCVRPFAYSAAASPALVARLAASAHSLQAFRLVAPASPVVLQPSGGPQAAAAGPHELIAGHWLARSLDPASRDERAGHVPMESLDARR